MADSLRSSNKGRKRKVTSAKRDELTGLGGMRQTTDNGRADWLVWMMETLRESHNPSCLLPLKRQSHRCQATASIRGSNHRLEEMCALIVRPTKMMSLQRGSVKTGNSGIKGSKSQGLLQRSWVQGIHFLCFLLLLKQPYSAF